jgi:hypothetical protein
LLSLLAEREKGKTGPIAVLLLIAEPGLAQKTTGDIVGIVMIGSPPE